MAYQEEAELRRKILEAIRDAYPGRAGPVSAQVDLWFTWWWQAEPPASDPSKRCGWCTRMRANHRREVCVGCLKSAQAIAKDAEAPLRDMVRTDALRALRGDDVGTETVDRIARLFPDLRRLEAACAWCSKTRAAIGSERYAVCLGCLK